MSFSIMLLFICWKYITSIAFKFKQKTFPGGREEIYKQLKIEFNLLEEKKRQLFASWDFDELDYINDEILNIMVKIEKVEKLLI